MKSIGFDGKYSVVRFWELNVIDYDFSKWNEIEVKLICAKGIELNVVFRLDDDIIYGVDERNKILILIGESDYDYIFKMGNENIE